MASSLPFCHRASLWPSQPPGPAQLIDRPQERTAESLRGTKRPLPLATGCTVPWIPPDRPPHGDHREPLFLINLPQLLCIHHPSTNSLSHFKHPPHCPNLCKFPDSSKWKLWSWRVVWSRPITLLSRHRVGTSLVVQWLKLHASTAEGMGSIPGQGTKILHATRPSQEF